jgi:hypothetical protein
MARGGRSFAIQASDAVGDGGGGGGDGGEPYVAQAVTISSDAWFHRGAALTGATGQYNQLLFSVWTKRPPTYGEFFASMPNYMAMAALVDPGEVFLSLCDADINTDALQVAIPTGVWTHLLFSYDFDQQSFKVAVDGVVSGIAPNMPNIAAPTLAAEDDFQVGFGEGTVADYADFWLGFGQWLDITVPANLAKFIDSDGKPVDLGTDGSTPTGTKPTLFFSGGGAEFATNKGTGGPFTLGSGTLTDASSSPSHYYAPAVYMSLDHSVTALGLQTEGPPTGVVDGTSGALSYWRRSTVDDNSVISNFSSSFSVTNKAARSSLYIGDVDGNIWVEGKFTTPLNDGSWHHVLMSWDTDFSAPNRVIRCWIDDAPVTLDLSDQEGGPISIAYAAAWQWIPRGNDADYADVAVYLNTVIDFSVVANRRKFIDAAGKPVDPTSFPAGAVFLFSGDGRSFSTNRGSGGPVVINSPVDPEDPAFVDATTSPSD